MLTLDWIVLGLFFVLLTGVVWWVIPQQEETSTDYFLAGRNAGWLAIGASIFASNIGSASPEQKAKQEQAGINGMLSIQSSSWLLL